MIDMIPGKAGELFAGLGERAMLHDLYDEVGSAVYHDIAGTAAFEIRELITLSRSVPGPVLDLAAGSGRLTFPLLAAGREVTALELSPSMLGILAERLASAPIALRQRCTMVRADMRAFSLNTSFGVIALGATSISLLEAEGRQSAYQSIRRHMSSGGRLIMSTVDINAHYRGPMETEIRITGDSGRDYRIFEYIDLRESSRTVTVFPDSVNADKISVCVSSIKMLSPETLTEELSAADLRVCGQYGFPDVEGRLRGVLVEARIAS